MEAKDPGGSGAAASTGGVAVGAGGYAAGRDINVLQAAAVPSAPYQRSPDVAHFTDAKRSLTAYHTLFPEDGPGGVVISAIAGTAGVGKTTYRRHILV